MRSRRSVTLSLSLLLLATSVGAAESNGHANLSPQEARIQRDLQDSTTFEFIDTPLADAIDLIEQHHKLPVEVDRRALEEAGIDATKLRIDRTLVDVSLRSALQIVLRDVGLTYIVANDILTITTPEAAEAAVVTRIYPVDDIVSTLGVDVDKLAKVAHSIRQQPQLSPATYSSPALAADGRTSPVQSLPKMLIVTDNYPNHERIQQLLGDIRSTLNNSSSSRTSTEASAEKTKPATVGELLEQLQDSPEIPAEATTAPE